MEQPKKSLMARLRASRKAQGLVRLEFWVPKDAAWAVKAYVKQLLKKRATDSGKVQRGKE